MVVNIGIELIEGSAPAVGGIGIARSNRIFGEPSRAQANRVHGVAGGGGPGPGANLIGADGAELSGSFGVVVPAGSRANPARSDGFLIDLGEFARLSLEARRKAPKEVGFYDRAGNVVFQSAVDAVQVVALLVMAKPVIQ